MASTGRKDRTIVALVVLLTTPPVCAASEGELAALYRASYSLEAQRDYAGALAKMEEARRVAGRSYFISARSAWLCYLAKDYGAAVAHYQDASLASPEALEPRLGLILALAAQRDWRALESACNDVLRRDPNSVGALERLAQAEYWLKDYRASEAVYRRLVSEYPSDAVYRTALGWVLLRLGRSAEARAVFEEALVLAPDDATAQQGYALVR